MSDHVNIEQLRLYVDGELSAEDAALIEQRLESDAELRRLVEFERRLRQHVAAAMVAETPEVPADLESRVRAALAAPPEATGTPEIAGRIEPATAPIVQTTPARANFFAVAASLTIVAGAVLFGIFGRPIDRAPQLPQTVDVINQSASFISGEHDHCLGNEQWRESKLEVRDAATAFEFLGDYLGPGPFPLIDLAEIGFEFIGGGKCGVPAANRSGHIMYRRLPTASDPSTPMVSIFMVPDEGQFDHLRNKPRLNGRWIELSVSANACPVLFATNGDIGYFLCSCDPMILLKASAKVQEQVFAP